MLAPHRSPPFALSLLVHGSLVAQDELTRAIVDLGYPERQLRAQAVLEASGAQCVALLRDLLARVATADDPRPLQVVGALYVIGRLRAAAIAALPEVRHVCSFAGDTEVRNQSLWALARLAQPIDGPPLRGPCTRRALTMPQCAAFEQLPSNRPQS
ncbi:MAG: hypothetical protein ABIP94_19500 [Planctomycetota bacterium]